MPTVWFCNWPRPGVTRSKCWSLPPASCFTGWQRQSNDPFHAMKLILPAALRIGIEDAARASFPRECCGLIEGVREDGAARALALHPARNIASEVNRFEIEPADHFAALRKARANTQDVIGCYHSHPGGKVEPSSSDLEGAGEENFFWLIASMRDRHAPVMLAAFVYSAACFFP